MTKQAANLDEELELAKAALDSATKKAQAAQRTARKAGERYDKALDAVLATKADDELDLLELTRQSFWHTGSHKRIEQMLAKYGPELRHSGVYTGKPDGKGNREILMPGIQLTLAHDATDDRLEAVAANILDYLNTWNTTKLDDVGIIIRDKGLGQYAIYELRVQDADNARLNQMRYSRETILHTGSLVDMLWIIRQYYYYPALPGDNDDDDEY